MFFIFTETFLPKKKKPERKENKGKDSSKKVEINLWSQYSHMHAHTDICVFSQTGTCHKQHTVTHRIDLTFSERSKSFGLVTFVIIMVED